MKKDGSEGVGGTQPEEEIGYTQKTSVSVTEGSKRTWETQVKVGRQCCKGL